MFSYVWCIWFKVVGSCGVNSGLFRFRFFGGVVRVFFCVIFVNAFVGVLLVLFNNDFLFLELVMYYLVRIRWGL